ncbi:MAG: hypothetical protein JSS99_10660 [Actinobacteria bacterium]|nr:hypothetical protein [Actinomycetota bacterium]
MVLLVVMAAQVPGAWALTGMSFSPGRSVTQTGTFRVTRSGEGTVVVECPITLSGSFAEGLVAVREGEEPSFGSLSSLSSGSCTRGSITAILGFPVSMRWSSSSDTAPAGAMLQLSSLFIVSIRARLSTGEECRFEGLGVTFPLEGLGNNEYALGRGSMPLFECGFVYLPTVSFSAPSPSQVVTFLPGNEVINGFTPNPLVFGTVRAGELVQRTVTIGSSAGGRIEEIVVTSQRYFAITDPNGCRSRTLEARGTCNINVILSAPTEAGRAVSDTLTVRIAERRFSGTLRATT